MDGYTPLTFQIKDENVDRYIEMLSNHFGYRVIDIDGEPILETRGVFAKRKIANTLSNWVEEEERKEALGNIVIEPPEIIGE